EGQGGGGGRASRRRVPGDDVGRGGARRGRVRRSRRAEGRGEVPDPHQVRRAGVGRSAGGPRWGRGSRGEGLAPLTNLSEPDRCVVACAGTGGEPSSDPG